MQESCQQASGAAGEWIALASVADRSHRRSESNTAFYAAKRLPYFLFLLFSLRKIFASRLYFNPEHSKMQWVIILF